VFGLYNLCFLFVTNVCSPVSEFCSVYLVNGNPELIYSYKSRGFVLHVPCFTGLPFEVSSGGNSTTIFFGAVVPRKSRYASLTSYKYVDKAE
jgi:hypothetical protein